MAKAPASGYQVNQADVPLILAMIARGDRKHDVAAWFGLNQGRIKEVEDGRHGNPAMASEETLPPPGSPGPRARELRHQTEQALRVLNQSRITENQEAARILKRAILKFDKAE